MNWFGDFEEDATIHIPFTTNDASGGAVAPSSAFEAADVKIYKDGSAVEKTTTNGITMSSPFDTITGLHTLDIDTSINTGDIGFWTVGSDYAVVLVPDETVDGQTVVSVLAQFSIENRGVAGAKATWDRVLTGSTHNIPSSGGRRMRAIPDVVGGAVDDVSASTTAFITNLTAAHDDHYNDQTIVFITGTLAGMSRIVEAFNKTTKLLTIDTDEPLPEAPADADEFEILATHTHRLRQIVDALWDEPLTKSSHDVPNSGGRRLRQLGGAIVDDSTVNDASATDTAFISALPSAVDDFYNDALISFTSGNLQGQSRAVLDYDGATKTVTVDEPWTEAPANTDEFIVYADHIHPIVQIAQGVYDKLSNTAVAELSSAPVATADIITIIKFLQMYFQNKKTVTTNQEAVHDSADTEIATAAISGDETIRTKDKLS